MIEILHRYTKAMLYKADVSDVKEAVTKAVEEGADLRGAYLRGADLGGAYLSGANLGGAYLGGAYLSGANLGGAYLGGANLRGANLSGANLGGAYLSGADLRGANLGGANLRGANLGGADLRGAYLRGADLGGANLRGADLRGAYLSGADLRGAEDFWNCHDIISEILRRAAGEDIEKLSLAGLVLMQRQWCWDDFNKLVHPQREWAVRTFVPLFDDDTPDCLREAAEKLKKDDALAQASL